MEQVHRDTESVEEWAEGAEEADEANDACGGDPAVENAALLAARDEPEQHALHDEDERESVQRKRVLHIGFESVRISIQMSKRPRRPADADETRAQAISSDISALSGAVEVADTAEAGRPRP